MRSYFHHHSGHWNSSEGSGSGVGATIVAYFFSLSWSDDMGTQAREEEKGILGEG